MDQVDYLVEYRNMEDDLVHVSNSFPGYPTLGSRIVLGGKEYEVVEFFLKNGKRRYWWSLGFRFDSFYFIIFIDNVD